MWTFGRRRSAVGSSAWRRKTLATFGVASDPISGASNGLAVQRGGRRRGRRSFGVGEDRPGATLWRREEVSGGRRWRRVSSVFGENGKEGVGWLCCAQGRE